MPYDPVALKRFIKAVDDVKRGYICKVCSDFCKNPVTLSTCFHIICEEHFDGLKACPTCRKPLNNCTLYKDDRLQICIENTKRLGNIVDEFKSVNTPKSSATDKTSGDSKKRKRTAKAKENIENAGANIDKKYKVKKPLENVIKKEINTSFSSINTMSEKRNTKGETALHIACRVGDIEKVKELLQQGANANTKDNAGWTPLHEAVQNGRLDIVQVLLQYNTLINVPGQHNETPLHEAVRYHHKDIAIELVKNGADIDARNCKGETPLQLAKGEIKKLLQSAAENIIQTQSVNIRHISEIHLNQDFEDVRIYCTSDTRTVQNKLKTLCKHHNNVNIEESFTKKVTHLLVDVDGYCTSSLDILQGIVSSLWILSTEWIINSTNDNLEPFEKYEVKIGTARYEGPRNSRINKYKLLPGIFNGCHFYLHNFNTMFEISIRINVNKGILTKLITDGGGIVLRRVPNPESIPESEKLVPYHSKKGSKLSICSHFIIYKDMYEPQYNMQHLKALPVAWLIECIEKYELCDP